MDTSIRKKIEDMINSEDMVIRINRSLHRDPHIIDGHGFEHTGWMDTKQSSLPGFLIKVLKMQFAPNPVSKSKDLLLMRLTKDPSFANEFLRHQHLIMGDILARFNDLNEGASSVRAGNVSSMLANASLAELSKQQLLSSAPLFGHNLAAGGHPVHASIPDSYDMTDDFAFKCGELFRSIFSTVRKDKFTVPALTSQGMLLKTARDTPQWRVYAKALQSALATKITSRKQFDDVCDQLDEVFRTYGYDGITRDFYLGMRRQGTRKDEPVSSRYDFDTNRDYDIGGTHGVQGRSRGIFPPTELLKIYFKPFAEGIKTDLFKSGTFTAVNLPFISNKVHILAGLTQMYDLYTEEGELTCFYDLSAMDTTTHEGFMNSYLAFCRGVFPDFDAVEGDTVKFSRLHFPATIWSDEFFVQDIKGRSTLSGQPDVTTKNNICHLLAMAWCLGHALDIDKLAVFRCLLTGENVSGIDFPIIGHVHGDDTMLYAGPDKATYDKYFMKLNELGFVTSFEKAPIFLKKTVCVDDVSCSSDDASAYYGWYQELLQSLGRIKSDPSVGEELTELLNDKVIAVLGGRPMVEDYNYNFNGGMRPIVGSLVKNRYGEYAISEPILLLMGLSDTACLLGNHAMDEVKAYWHLLAHGALDDVSDLPLWESLRSLDPSSLFEALASTDVRNDIRHAVVEIAESSVTKALSIRNALERLFYTQGEIIDDNVIDTVFGSLFIDPDTQMDTFDLRDLSVSQLTELIISLQHFILDTNGKAPEIDEKIFDASNKIIGRIGKV